MKIFSRFLVVLLCGYVICSGLAYAGDAELAQDYKTIRSQLQSMGHGYYSQEEWISIFAQLDALSAEANAVNRDDLVVEAALLKAQALSDMQGRHTEAMNVLQALKSRYDNSGPKNMKKVYVLQAELYAKQGDAAAISRLIEEFNSSPFYDGQQYAYTGGKGRNDPLFVVRPGASGNNSITVTAMKKALESAHMAPGHLSPRIQARDANGAPVTLNDYSGKVVLLDFWLSQWKPWVRDLPELVATYNRYHGQGFEILGFTQDRDKVGAQQLLAHYGATWPQLIANADMWKDFGVYGEARNVLIDGQGMIIGSDLHGAELVNALKRALRR